MNSKPSPVRKWLRNKMRTIAKIKKGDVTLTSVIRNKWQKLKRFVSLNRIEEVPLSCLLIGQQRGISIGKWVENTGEYSRVSTLLIDSPYTDFLRQVDSDQSILQDNDRLKNTPYYLMAEVCLQYTGNFMGKSMEQDILQWMREFYAFYTSLRSGTSYRSEVFLDDGHSGAEEPVQAFKIRDSEYYEIIDGHHRCAIACMSGRETIPVEIAGEMHSYLQSLIIKSTGSPGQPMPQPVDAPEVKDWPVREDCRKWVAQKLRFLNDHSLPAPGDTYLEIPCSYGYSLRFFKQQGLRVFGVDPDKNGLQIAKSVHGIEEDECRRENTLAYLDGPAGKFSIVSFNSVIAPADESTPVLLKKLDGITERVLFLRYDVPATAGRDAWEEKIRNLIREQTAFRKTIFLKNGIIACAR